MALLTWMLAHVGTTPPALAASCYSTTYTPVCACTGCGYFVFCGAKLGPTGMIEIAYCTGNNPGFLVTGSVSTSQGLNSNTCYVSTCGTAFLTGVCCGGARTTTADWSVYQACPPSGARCGPGGTGG